MKNISRNEMKEIRGGYGIWCDTFDGGDCTHCLFDFPLIPTFECIQCQTGFADCDNMD